MSYDADVPDSYWYVTTTASIGMKVNERTAQTISDEYDRGDRLLVFTDLCGSECRIASAQYIGCWSSTPASRAMDRAFADQRDSEDEFS